MTGPLKFLRLPCFLEQKDIPVSACTLPASVNSPKSPDSCEWRMGFRHQDLGTRGAHYVLALSVDSAKKCIMFIHVCNTYLYLFLYLCKVKSFQFGSIISIRIQHYRAHFSLTLSISITPSIVKKCIAIICAYLCLLIFLVRWQSPSHVPSALVLQIPKTSPAS